MFAPIPCQSAPSPAVSGLTRPASESTATDGVTAWHAGWREVLVEDRSCGPAELAASRIDFIAWLASLPSRDRKIAKLLASGCGTSEVAGKDGLSWARVSQLRRELKVSWDKFHEPREKDAGGDVTGELVEAA